MSGESGSSSDEIQYSNSDSNNSDITLSEPPIIHGIVVKLTTQVEHEKFIQSTIHERLEIIEGMFSQCEPLLRIEPMRIPKSNDESFKYEEAGIQEDSKANCNKALFLCNKSIAFAETDYPNLYRLYERRANALHKMKLFQAYLHSLELTIKYCPSNLKKKYNNQKANFMQNYHTFQSREESRILKCQNDIDSLTKVENDRKHPDVPFIANCIELKDTENYGRGIFAKSDLNPGDVVAIDRAYATVLYGTYQYRHCSNCLKENWSLIPCPDCTTAMYCNEKCLQIAWKKFHKHECKISNYIMKVFPSNYLMCFRLPLQTVQLFGDIDPLIEFEETHQQMDIRSFDIFNVDHDDDGEVVHCAGNENFNSRMTALNYHPVHELIKDVSEPPVWTINMYLCTAVLTLLIYRLFREIFNITTDNQKRFVQTFIYRHVRGARSFTYGLYMGRRRKDDIVYGSALYPFASLINHSCAPNLILVKNGSSATIIVAHPIKQNEQLFYHYGPHFEFDEKSDRQKELQSRWYFTCQCVACTEDYPQLDYLPTCCVPCEPRVCLPVDPTNLKLKKLIDDIKALFMFRRDYVHLYPCQNSCLYEDNVLEYLIHLFRRLSGSVYMNC